MTCVFCCADEEKRNLYETDNFFVKVGKGIITAGHVMIIPKYHYKAIGEIDSSIMNEYLDLKKFVVDKVSNTFAEPFMIEYGAYGQSVFHAHIHIIPKTGNNYQNVDLYKDMILPSKTDVIEISKFQELKDYYDENKHYIYFEDKKKCILPITDIIKNNIEVVGYRSYFTKLGLKGISNWKTMTEEDIEKDKRKVQITKEKLIFN